MLTRQTNSIVGNDEAIAEAVKAFLSVPKSFTIRQGKVSGKDQLDTRLRRAILAYLDAL